ncbi:unnamed protein product [Nesidiocoris tenuis]|uniref:Rap-GAP domain-containing protein n=1 Tax=Nesidiocoris tenuis TaxID=355587 RepID=A0A6H5GGS2_9HEMI|nr:unnamed protein product [Nesidiocoris tenuis]
MTLSYQQPSRIGPGIRYWSNCRPKKSQINRRSSLELPGIVLTKVVPGVPCRPQGEVRCVPCTSTCRGGMMEERRGETNSSGSGAGGRGLLEKALEGGGPYPTIVLPSTGGYWCDTGESSPQQQLSLLLPSDHQPKYYRTHFLGQALNRELTLSSLEPVLCPRASHLIAAYDEHVLVSQYKFGVLYQKFGQTSEEELFGNKHSSPAFDEFLNCLGHRINLKFHKGYRGGLDTQFGQTGEEAIYQVFKETEMIFHVSTLLPYTDNDPQQLQRKRHIGNDIVAIVFQEKNTPFSPDMVASHFLHAFIVVQVIEPNTPNTRYKVNVTARDDVPAFGPPLPDPPIFPKGPELREYLLEKLIAAESACYKANKFAQLELRTRSSLLESLVNDLREKSREFLSNAAPETPTEFPETPKSETGTGNRFIDTVRKALIARVRSQENNNNNNVKKMSNGHTDNDPCPNCQREIKRLRERELGLQSELAAASREILRLRELFKDYSSKDNAPTTL